MNKIICPSKSLLEAKWAKKYRFKTTIQLEGLLLNNKHRLIQILKREAVNKRYNFDVPLSSGQNFKHRIQEAILSLRNEINRRKNE